jgi:type II secretory pathway component PulF
MMKAIWAFPVVLGTLLLVILGVIFLPSARGKYFMRLPAFKEASISRVAATLTLLLKNGVALPDSVALAEQLETTSGTAADLRQWRQNLAAGAAKFSEVAAANRVIPPLFVWVVSGAGEDLTTGFSRAAELYYSRALYRTEVALYSVMPFASIFLGVIVLSQAMMVISMFLPFISMLTWLGD